MCTGAEIAAIAIPLVTGAATTKFQGDAAKDVRKAKQQAQATFQQDLDEQRRRANVNLQSSLGLAGEEQTQERLGEATQARAEANQPRFDTRTLLPGQGDASSAAKTAIIQAQDQGDASIADAGQRAAVLAAFGDADLRRNIGLLQNANRINTAGNFAQGAGPVLQAGLSAAESAGDKNLGIADAIGGIGALAGAAAPQFSAGGFTIPGTGSQGTRVTGAGGKVIPVPGVKPKRINFASF